MEDKEPPVEDRVSLLELWATKTMGSSAGAGIGVDWRRIQRTRMRIIDPYTR
jgi:hypothetical protein